MGIWKPAEKKTKHWCCIYGAFIIVAHTFLSRRRSVSYTLTHTHTSNSHSSHTPNWAFFKIQYPISNVRLAPLFTTVIPSLPIFFFAYCSKQPSILPSILQVPGPRPGEKPITDLDTLCMHTLSFCRPRLEDQGPISSDCCLLSDWCVCRYVCVRLFAPSAGVQLRPDHRSTGGAN